MFYFIANQILAITLQGLDLREIPTCHDVSTLKSDGGRDNIFIAHQIWENKN